MSVLPRTLLSEQRENEEPDHAHRSGDLEHELKAEHLGYDSVDEHSQHSSERKSHTAYGARGRI